MTIWWKWDGVWGLRSGCVGRLRLRLRCWVGSASRILIDKIVKRIVWIRIVDDRLWLWCWRCYWIRRRRRRMVETMEWWCRRWEVMVLRNQRVLIKLWDGLEGWSIIVGAWLNHITNSDDSRVDLVGVDIFQEESMEFWGYEVQGSWIMWSYFEVGNKLKCLIVMCNYSEGIFFNLKKPLNFIEFLLPLFISFWIKLCDGSFCEGGEENISTIWTRSNSNTLRWFLSD